MKLKNLGTFSIYILAEPQENFPPPNNLVLIYFLKHCLKTTFSILEKSIKYFGFEVLYFNP